MGFEHIVGQELVKRVIEKTLRTRRVASSYLFYGPPGVGKATTALTLAKAINCQEGGVDSCDRCKSCKRIERFNHSNVRVIIPTPPKVGPETVRWSLKEGRPDYGAKGSITIDTVRSLRREISMRPFEKGRRVIIILDADRMTQDASNAFLKSLEEPPLDTTFILTTTRVSSLLPTVVSRCYPVPFRRLGRREIEDELLERTKVSRDQARLFSLISEGSLGRALELCKEGGGAYRGAVVDLISHPPEKRVLEEVEGSLEEVIGFLLMVYRDLLVLKEVGDEVVVNIDLLPKLKAKAGVVSREEIGSSIRGLLEANVALGRNVSPKLIWTNLLTRLA